MNRFKKCRHNVNTCMVTTEWICLLAFSRARWARRVLWILMALKWWKSADVKRSLLSALAFSNAFEKEWKKDFKKCREPVVSLMAKKTLQYNYKLAFLNTSAKVCSLVLALFILKSFS